MEKKVIQKNLIRDCLPTVFSLMLSGLYSVMDGLFVGRAAGDTGLAAVNLAWPLVAVITATGIGSRNFIKCNIVPDISNLIAASWCKKRGTDAG